MVLPPPTRMALALGGAAVRPASARYENRNFDMQTNGEEWYLRQLGKPGGEIKYVFDIGANVGDWLLLCRRYLPGATIHAFEIAPPTFDKLQKNWPPSQRRSQPCGSIGPE